jgi:uracil-DNA glycosylase family 4
MKNFYSDLAQLARDIRHSCSPGFRIPPQKNSGKSSIQAIIDDPIVNGLEGLKASLAQRVIPKEDLIMPIVVKPILAPGTDISTAIRSCERCPRCHTRTKAVPGVGPDLVSYMIVADTPSPEDDLMGLPFVGSTGQFFDKWLEAIGLSRYTDTFLTTLVKCRNTDGTLRPEDSATCGVWLAAQIELLRPVGILVLGETAAAWFSGTLQNLAALRQQIFHYNHGNYSVAHLSSTPWMATYHPAEVMRNPELKRPVWEDLKAFKAAFAVKS